MRLSDCLRIFSSIILPWIGVIYPRRYCYRSTVCNNSTNNPITWCPSTLLNFKVLRLAWDAVHFWDPGRKCRREFKYFEKYPISLKRNGQISPKFTQIQEDTTISLNILWMFKKFLINAYQNSFFPRTITSWNMLPESCIASASLDAFKSTIQLVPLVPSYIEGLDLVKNKYMYMLVVRLF